MNTTINDAALFSTLCYSSVVNCNAYFMLVPVDSRLSLVQVENSWAKSTTKWTECTEARTKFPLFCWHSETDHLTLYQHWFRNNWQAICQIDEYPMPRRHIAKQGINNFTHRGRDKVDAISQTTFSNAFAWMKMPRLKLHWSLLLRV